MFKFLFLLFLLVPLIELYVLIEIGQQIGAGMTIFLVVATAIMGALLVRIQGFTTFVRAQQSIARGQAPAVELLEGLALFISGFMLLVPGFVTDALGFLLLVPPIRQAFARHILKNQQFMFRGHYQQSGTHRRSKDGDVIEGEVVDDDDPRHLR